jgi:hypothetical protein
MRSLKRTGCWYVRRKSIRLGSIGSMRIENVQNLVGCIRLSSVLLEKEVPPKCPHILSRNAKIFLRERGNNGHHQQYLQEKLVQLYYDPKRLTAPRIFRYAIVFQSLRDVLSCPFIFILLLFANPPKSSS